MVEGIDQKELDKIAQRFIDEIDNSQVRKVKCVEINNYDSAQDDLISFDEFVKVMDTCEVENRMSIKFMGWKVEKYLLK